MALFLHVVRKAELHKLFKLEKHLTFWKEVCLAVLLPLFLFTNTYK